MLLKTSIAQAIAAGTVSRVYRRWTTPKTKAGSTFVTGAGVLEVVRVEKTTLKSISDTAATAAGYESREDLLDELRRYSGNVYCITLRHQGADPRIDLRKNSRFTSQEYERLRSRLLKLGARTADGPWALRVLQSIGDQPARRAGDLADQLGVERLKFKARVRQLKELGLTESLEVGYRLSPRGRALLRRLEKE